MLNLQDKHVYFSSLFGGAAAGLTADVVLYPLDTLKTRLQSQQGFIKAGGFQHIYKGIGPQVLGSAPQAALFFLTYESFKHFVVPHAHSHALPLVYMTGASLGEIVACLIRVPMEVVKQRRQTSLDRKQTSSKIFMHALKTEGFFKGLYRGFGSTVIREVPFAFIQLPILEYLKIQYKSKLKNDRPLDSGEVALCGAIAGGSAAALTTPLDVVKTRIMLAEKTAAKNLRVRTILKQVYHKGGISGLFSGFVPRVLWITLGGSIFFGTYDLGKNFCSKYILEIEYDES